MPKYYITLPALPGKHFEVEAEDILWATVKALNHTVWTEARAQRWLSESQLIDEFGRPVNHNLSPTDLAKNGEI